MRIPDWIVLFAVLGIVLWALFSGARDSADAPEAPPTEIFSESGKALPLANAYDEEILVQIGEAADGIGTAFSIDQKGLWMTARHVVDSCENVGLLYGGGRVMPVTEVSTSEDSDIAILKTLRAPRSLAIDASENLRLNQAGFHVGYPQGEPGEVSSRLLARSRLITRGRYRNEEPVLTWAEMGRTRGLKGTLAGISGGPVFDVDGRIVGVTVAESPRRGRIYTTAPESLAIALNANEVTSSSTTGMKFGTGTYGQEADRLRRELSVVKVICHAPSTQK